MPLVMMLASVIRTTQVKPWTACWCILYKTEPTEGG